MIEQLNIRIAGEAGQGMQTIGEALARLYKNSGKHVFANQDYMSRVRGGNNFFQLRVADDPVRAIWSKCDIIAVLDKDSIEIHKGALGHSGLMVLDSKKFNAPAQGAGFFDVPFYQMAESAGGSELFVNMAVFGAIACMTGVDFAEARKVIYDIFADKSEDIVKKNIESAAAGHDHSKDKFMEQRLRIASSPAKGRLLMDGSRAIALGAIKAGCKFYSAYPMTPSTGILNAMAHYAGRFGIVVEQAEDEIAAINMVIGASYCGARSMCATSGGGFALMAEGFSLAGMTEVPIVVADAQRPGPATGFPTRTEQADLDMLIHAGHGEFARVVFSPGNIEEAFYLAQKAFDISEKYQIPAIIMTDQHLADCIYDIEAPAADNEKVKRHIISREASRQVSGYKRYAFTDNGISPRAVPSWIEDVIYADSDEHTEEGHITEDAAVRVMMVEKRLYKKMAGLTKEVVPPVEFNTASARTILLGFGSTYETIKESARRLGIDFGCLHLPQVWPMPVEKLKGLLDGKKLIVIEHNAAAQLARLLKREAGIIADHSILRYDGRPFCADELCQKIKETGL